MATGLATGFLVQPRRFTLDDIVADPAVPLSGLDRRMAEDLLKVGETATLLQPLASERVPHLVRVEPRNGSRTRTAVANDPGESTE
jgi:hypothetical protein